MLFDENLSFFGFSIPSEMPNLNLETVSKGFEKGNMFSNLYDPYKNYEIAKLVPKTKKEELLLNIMALSFAINDLNLYLDLHPKDSEVLKKFKEINEPLCKQEMEYINNYGPLEVNDVDSIDKFTWINNPWPWDCEEVKYV